MLDTSRPRNSTLPVCCLTHIVQDGFTSTIYVLFPVLAQAFGLTYAHVGLLKGLMSAVQAILEFASGWVADRVGEVQLIAIGLILSGVGYLCLAVSPSVLLISICLLLIGAGTALHHAPSSSLIANGYQADRRSGALGIYNASGDVGKLLFTGCFSLSAGAGLAWYQISFVYGLMGFVAAIVIAMTARSFKRHSQSDSEKETVSVDQAVSSGWGILNWRSFSSLLVASGIDTVAQTGIFVFIAFLMLSKGLPLWLATGATVILLAGGVFGKAGCGFLSERMGAHRAFILIQILTALGLVAIVVAPNWLALILLFPLGMVAQGSSSITYGFAAGLIHPARMARGYALLYSAGTLASAAGPLALGWVADVSGIETAVYVMAVIVLLSIPPMLFLPVKSCVAADAV